MPESPTTLTASNPAASEQGAGAPPEALGELREMLRSLLEVQCAVIGAAAGVAILAGGESRRAGILATFTANGDGALLSPALLARAERMAAELASSPVGGGRAETITLPRRGTMYGEETRARLLAAPLVAEGRVEGSTVLVLPGAATIDTTDALRLASLVGGKFEAYLWRRQCLAEAEQKAMLRETVELLDAAQQGESAGTMGAILCHELRRRFGCTRVSIGLVARDAVRLAAVSGSDDIDRTAPAVEPLEAAMEECAAQDTEILHPPPPGADADPMARHVTRAHEELHRRFGPSSILSLPLRVEGDLVGVTVLERPGSDPFPAGAAALLRLVAETIGPALWTRRLADRGVYAVARDRVYELGEALVGPRHTGAKLLALGVLLTILGITVIPIPSRVAAEVEIRASVARTIVPPFAGYLSSVAVRPGDAVEEGQVLATMDTADLEARLFESQSRVASLDAQRDEALGRGELNKVKVLAAQTEEVRATIILLGDHLEKSSIRAPIAGLVGRGELDQLVNARVDPTQPLFEIVGKEHRAVVHVGERDVPRVHEGQTGFLTIKARPGVRIPIRVTRLNPAAEVVHSSNVYEAQVELGSQPAWLRPGMTGSARLDDGWTTTLSKLLRPLADELRLRLWW